jgi:ABC-2 type transport system ATP-binding protein
VTFRYKDSSGAQIKNMTVRMRLKHYSKSMRQKLGIAIALLKDPPAILMDEPTSGLDPTSAHEFLAQLR